MAWGKIEKREGLASLFSCLIFRITLGNTKSKNIFLHFEGEIYSHIYGF